MKKLIQCALFLIAFSNFGYANAAVRHGPIIVGGGGESEYAILFARAHLSQLVSMCNSCRCALDPENQKIIDELIARSRNAPAAFFSDSSRLGNQLYELSGNTVWFNQDLLWLDTGRSRAFDVPRATSLWIEILAAGNLAQERIALIQAEIEAMLSNKVIRSVFAFDDHYSFESLILKLSSMQDQFFLRDAEFKSINITATLQASLGCAISQLTTMQINGARWMNRNRLDVVLTWACSGKAHRGRLKVIIVGKPSIDPASVKAYLEGE